ncbi:MAG: GNAT family N-acetyltransferase, partial [Bacteroidia bacterium]
LISSLETPRLLLREMRESDAESFFLLNEDPEVIKYTGDKEFLNKEDLRNFLLKYPSISYLKDGYGRWTCINKATDEIIGWCGLRKQADGEIDLGYRFHKRFWNMGYATESGFYSLKTGFETLNLDSIVAVANRENIGSWKVMEKLKMQFSHHREDQDAINKVYRITRADYLMIYQSL